MIHRLWSHITNLITILACYSCIYIYSAELYPTSCRNTGFACCVLASRIAGIIVPKINQGKSISPSVGPSFSTSVLIHRFSWTWFCEVATTNSVWLFAFGGRWRYNVASWYIRCSSSRNNGTSWKILFKSTCSSLWFRKLRSITYGP